MVSKYTNNRSGKFLVRLGLAAPLAALLMFQNCAPEHQIEVAHDPSEEQVRRDVEAHLSLASCRFMGREALRSQLETQLGLVEGRVPMANEQGQPLQSRNCKSYTHQTGNGTRACFYLQEYAQELENQECNESTFSLVSKIMVNACREGLRDSRVAQRLFPSTSADPSQAYLAFTGQRIRDNEKEVLAGLASQFESEEDKQAAICAAVGSSLSAISVN